MLADPLAEPGAREASSLRGEPAAVVEIEGVDVEEFACGIVFARADEDGARFGMRRAILRRSARAEDVKRRRQRVGFGAGGR